MMEIKKDINDINTKPDDTNANKNITLDPSIAHQRSVSNNKNSNNIVSGSVTPRKLSELLMRRGPLAIRHITQALNEDITNFKDLSSSKQRRLIMGAMDDGDKDNRIVFEKVGWGQWSARQLDDNEDFNTVLDITKKNNLKVRDAASTAKDDNNNIGINTNANVNTNTSSSSRRRSSNSAMVKKPETKTKNKNHPISSPAMTTNSPQAESLSQPSVLYIDEEVLASDEEDDIDIENRDKDMFAFNGRRKSTVVYASNVAGDNVASTADVTEHELMARHIRPKLRNNSRTRRSSSKSKSRPSINKMVPSTVNQQTDIQTFQHQQHFISGQSNKIDLDLLSRSTLSEPPSERPSRVSFSKESGIRSTLFASNGMYKGEEKRNTVGSTTFNNTSSDMSNRFAIPQIAFKNPHIGHNTVESFIPPSAEDTSHNNHEEKQTPSDTTEDEDWAAMGAEVLRNVKNSGTQNVLQRNQHANNVDDRKESQHRRGTDDENDGAILLMNLMK
ncbi:uncharacterized protein NDAI_0G02370 [Naumovozyma dairenensis CBS 421]|uniref:Protein STB3 n=1 Tax=Naumovozyma dairenensis (strain ATCC 10597 / BCRC 20456 / CBS 421 / NBRC 0211 / NRRL Y-12639) TaxID=1071378 RepID=G0WE01_NAUDC|nr:hypothetical protein NDAI_0G02370 [Naumovozyma dairenensis CBS 421]CCD26012.2 hypothetical protein NDAI_0G02370 [Naumovozyma dairenensis CBS 421]